MTSENKPGRGLVVRPDHVPVPLDRSKSDALLERARSRIGVAKSASAPVAALPPPASPAPSIVKPSIVKPSIARPAGDRVLVLMTCSALGKGFSVLAERRVNEEGVQVLLLLGGDELAGAGEVTAEAGKLSGVYDIEIAPGWRCPLCNSSNRQIWSCTCSRFAGALHCGGSVGGEVRYCACGRIEDRHLREIDVVEVRGRSLGAVSRQTVGGLPVVRSSGVRSRE